MSTSRILFSTSSFDTESNPHLRVLTDCGFELIFNPYGRRLTQPEAKELLQQGVVGVVAGVEPLTSDVLASAHALKVISRCGTGMDSVDVDAARERGIRVYNTPEAPADAVAELTLALMLNLLRQVSRSDRDMRAGQWKPLMGNLLRAQTVGIVGYGRVGRRVGGLTGAFGARVIAHDPSYTNEERGVESHTFEKLLAASDIVTLHFAPDTDRPVFNAARFAGMKNGALLINTARGTLIDEDALVTALQTGRIAGAALDTFSAEPYKGPLTAFPQVVLTAHMGSYAKESRSRMEHEAAANLIRGLAEQGLMPAAPAFM